MAAVAEDQQMAAGFLSHSVLVNPYPVMTGCESLTLALFAHTRDDEASLHAAQLNNTLGKLYASVCAPQR
jgi:hypothetical protein